MYLLFWLGIFSLSPKPLCIVLLLQAIAILQPCCYGLHIILTFIALRLNYILSFISASHYYKMYYPAFKDAVHITETEWMQFTLLFWLFDRCMLSSSLWLWYDMVLQDFSNMFWMQQEERLFLITCRRLLQGKELVSAGSLLSDSLDSHSCAALFIVKRKTKHWFT